MRRILAELPETLDETYERILLDIPKANQGHAHRLLQCLTVAIRPLKVDELAEVLAVDFSAAAGIPQLNGDLRWKDQEQAVISACSSLITIVDDSDQDSRIVQFSHFSVKEFLTSDRLAASNADSLRYHQIPLEPAHTIMAIACLSVLLRLDYLVDTQSIENFPLAEYSAHHFAKHAGFGSVISHMQDRIDLLLDTEMPHFAAWHWVASPSHSRGHHPEQPMGNPLHYMSDFGSPGLARYLISKHPQYLYDAVGRLGTPLHAAAAAAHTNAEVFRSLLGQYADVDVRDLKDGTPLYQVAFWGRLEACRGLIEQGADVNARGVNSWTPLHRVVFRIPEDPEDRYIDVIRFFLRHGADVNAQDAEHSTPLHIASREGCLKAVDILLEHGADARMKNNEGQTPNQVARGKYEEEIMQLLSTHAQSELHT